MNQFSVAHWISVPGYHSSTPGGGESFPHISHNTHQFMNTDQDIALTSIIWLGHKLARDDFLLFQPVFGVCSTQTLVEIYNNFLSR